MENNNEKLSSEDRIEAQYLILDMLGVETSIVPFYDVKFDDAVHSNVRFVVSIKTVTVSASTGGAESFFVVDKNKDGQYPFIIIDNDYYKLNISNILYILLDNTKFNI